MNIFLPYYSLLYMSAERRETFHADDRRIAPHLPGLSVRDHFFEDGILSVIAVLGDGRFFIRDHDDPNLWRELVGDEFKQYRIEYEVERDRIDHMPG